MSGIRSCIEKINNNKSGEYKKDYMKIKFDSDDKLPLNKQLKFLSVTIVIRAVFEDDGEYYPQAFLNIFCMNYKMLEYDRIDISEDIRLNKEQGHQESVIFSTIGIF